MNNNPPNLPLMDGTPQVKRCCVCHKPITGYQAYTIIDVSNADKGKIYYASKRYAHRHCAERYEGEDE